MRKTILIFIACMFRACLSVMAQNITQKTDTIVINKGSNKCEHDFVAKLKLISQYSCLAFHDARGCPSNWPDDFYICRICLRHIEVKTYYFLVPIKDDYSELSKKIKP